MNDQQLREFAPFWGVDAKKYVLLSAESSNTDLKNCVVFDRQAGNVELIEDPELALEVMQRMVEAGVEVVDELPVD